MKDYNLKLKDGTKIYVKFSLGGIDKDIIISELYYKKIFNILGICPTELLTPTAVPVRLPAVP